VTGFLIFALLLALVAAAFIALPLVRGRAGAPRARTTALVGSLLLVLLSALLYAWRGTNRWVTASDAPSISHLARHLEHDPQDADGWVELGQSYAQLGEYSLAQRAYRRANELDHDANATALSGIGEAMLLGGDAAQTAQAAAIFEHALLLDPRQARALFYSSLLAYRDGKLDLARQRSQALLALSPPQVVRAALEQQIAAIDAQQQGAGASPMHTDAATAIHLHVTLSPLLSAKVSANAALFVFVRAPDGGPPLAARRGTVSFPQDLELSAADAPVAGHSVQAGQAVSVVARISASGNPLPQSGDLVGEIKAIAGKGGTHALQIDHLSP
jgi:cytochrome c-type biogenesis protein CcmH